jgi:uncharacterized protein YndB with AHSA1/START domain
MTVISTTTDPENLTLTIVAEFDATPERVWSVWEDPRKLERWWGPPTYPATFTRHDFVVGGQSRYFMTGPAGNTSNGWWQMEVIDKPIRIEFANGFAGDDGEPMPDMPPATGLAIFEVTGGGTRMTAMTKFLDLAQMELMIGMGMAEGMTLAIGQIDVLLTSTAV